MNDLTQVQTLSVQLPEEIKVISEVTESRLPVGRPQDDVLIVDQSPADGHPLHLTAGELSWQVIFS